MLWLCGFRLQTVNKRWMQFPAVQNEASAFFWMSSRWRLLWPSSLIIWSWWVHGLSRCFQVSLNATVLIVLFPLEFVKKDKEGDAHWLTTCDWKSFTNEHTVPFSDFTNKQVTTLRPSVLYSLFPLQLRSLTCQQVFSTCSLTTVKQCGIKRELSLDGLTHWAAAASDHSFMLCELLTLSRPRLWAAAALWWIMFAYGRNFAGRFCISGSQQCEVRKSPGRAATLRNVQHWETHEDGIWKQHETHRSLKRRRRTEASRKPELKSTRTTTTKVLNASTAPVCPGEASQGSFTIKAPHMQTQGSGAGRLSAWLQGHTQCFLTDSLTNSSKCKVDPFQTLLFISWYLRHADMNWVKFERLFAQFG